MLKWKLFNWFKGKEKVPIGIQTATEKIEEPQAIPIEEYNETLYSQGFIQKQPTATLLEKKQPLNRSSWESLGTIEHKIDDMGCKQIAVLETRKQTSTDTNKNVDRILSKIKVRN